MIVEDHGVILFQDIGHAHSVLHNLFRIKGSLLQDPHCHPPFVSKIKINCHILHPPIHPSIWRCFVGMILDSGMTDPQSTIPVLTSLQAINYPPPLFSVTCYFIYSFIYLFLKVWFIVFVFFPSSLLFFFLTQNGAKKNILGANVAHSGTTIDHLYKKERQLCALLLFYAFPKTNWHNYIWHPVLMLMKPVSNGLF